MSNVEKGHFGNEGGQLLIEEGVKHGLGRLASFVVDCAPVRLGTGWAGYSEDDFKKTFYF
jgi:hypothetical protein